ncbi:hypothetical protein CN325_21225 [Bacillus thuringiensis]|uniref:hypothetical protein n=1 Tax=Bacillus thuringiensis TaxID=1428 RepID=UPI000BF2A6BA|nr:hypothetical protein [Bacillus thuringiensis]PFE93514.1 hypothetical protein CN325_21225 [Bacillus thuringiensis]
MEENIKEGIQTKGTDEIKNIFAGKEKEEFADEITALKTQVENIHSILSQLDKGRQQNVSSLMEQNQQNMASPMEQNQQSMASPMEQNQQSMASPMEQNQQNMASPMDLSQQEPNELYEQMHYVKLHAKHQKQRTFHQLQQSVHQTVEMLADVEQMVHHTAEMLENVEQALLSINTLNQVTQQVKESQKMLQ